MISRKLRPSDEPVRVVLAVDEHGIIHVLIRSLTGELLDDIKSTKEKSMAVANAIISRNTPTNTPTRH